MAEIVNLRQVRKAKKRQDEAQRADENRKRFGRTQSEKALQSREAQRAEATLDGAKREAPAILDTAKNAGQAGNEGREDDGSTAS